MLFLPFVCGVFTAKKINNLSLNTRLYSQRGSISANESSQERKRKRSIKFSTASEDPESDSGVFAKNGRPTNLSTEQGEQYIALTEITTQIAVPEDGEGSSATPGDIEEASEIQEVNVDPSGTQTELCDVPSDENTDSRGEVRKYNIDRDKN